MKIIKLFIYTTTILIVFATISCKHPQSNTALVPAIPVITHDTIVVHDTIKVSDESDIESIKYYKTLSERLWRAVEIVQLNTPESDRELHKLNQLIVTEREKHNANVTKTTIEEMSRIAHTK